MTMISLYKIFNKLNVSTNVSALALKIPPPQKRRYLGTSRVVHTLNTNLKCN